MMGRVSSSFDAIYAMHLDMTAWSPADQAGVSVTRSGTVRLVPVWARTLDCTAEVLWLLMDNNGIYSGKASLV